MFPQEIEAKVDNYWVANFGWNWAALSPLLPATFLLQLASISINPEEKAGDNMAWIESTFEDFSVALAYRVCCGEGKETK